ncbi:hypothetical protein HMPREF0388_0375 [Mobiluncus curtisii ATCC 51333]|uniref:Uncharacterized protein n=1 Tax=Mobiluncus curtisii ATCC 51333 TaxID=887326 RepID=E6LXA2_9ACTO|nr:hypothetical protein HMPREF0388_0375 [Mobiluncus curtisii ATCC 51333]
MQYRDASRRPILIDCQIVSNFRYIYAIFRATCSDTDALDMVTF